MLDDLEALRAELENMRRQEKETQLCLTRILAAIKTFQREEGDDAIAFIQEIREELEAFHKETMTW